MSILLGFAGVVVLTLVIMGIYVTVTGLCGGQGTGKSKTIYQYSAKKYFLTRAEHEFYDALGQAVGNDFRIFAQVHLSSILDERIKGQSWTPARAHINRKSIDYLLCDKENISPKLAIELDDKTHERPDRIDRDTEVERILNQAGLPLLRIENNGGFEPTTIASQIRAALEKK
jgi:very-short-patch-repair endonuclease